MQEAKRMKHKADAMVSTLSSQIQYAKLILSWYFMGMKLSSAQTTKHNYKTYYKHDWLC